MPILFETPWVNNHKQTEFFPLHSHNGFLSYAIWLQLPDVETNFNFHYLDTIGNIRKHSIKLTKEDNGSLILFPASWTHSHIGLAPKNDYKYIVTGWMRSNHELSDE